MKYKLRGDYSFNIGNNKQLQNKLDKDKNVIEHVIIDDNEYNVSNQMHKLEIIKDGLSDKKMSKQGNPKPGTPSDGGTKKGTGK